MTSNRLIGYARVSTAEQTVDQQIDALILAGCAHCFTDTVSGASTSRAGLDECLATLTQGDTLVVVRLDRLGRSMSHLVTVVQELAERGVAFRSLEEAIDTKSAAGKLVLHIFAALANFERELIGERTRESLRAKKRRGETLGRRRSLTPSQVREAIEMVTAGKGPTYVARMFRVDRATLYRALKRAGAAA